MLLHHPAAMQPERLDKKHYGIVAAATVGTMVNLTCSVHAIFGTFLIPLSQTFGWSRASISAVLGIVALIGATIYPFAGRYADKHGARRMLLAGNVALAACVALLAFSNGSLPRFYLTFALIGLAGALTGSTIYSKLVSDWFATRRGLFLGFTAGVGNGVGATLMPVLAGLLLTAYGWRVAYLGIAATIFLLGFPILFLKLHDAPHYDREHVDYGRRSIEGLSLAQAIRTPAFWLLLLSIASGAGCTTAVFSHVIPILAERGFGLGVGTSVLSAFALVCALWQIATGTMLDRVSTPRIIAPMYLLAVVGLALLEYADGTPLLLFGGALLGIGLGAQYGALPFLIARYFGLRAFGTITGSAYSAVVILQGLTPILLDHAFDLHGSYRVALVVIGICLTGGAALLLLLPSYRNDAESLPASVAAVI